MTHDFPLVSGLNLKYKHFNKQRINVQCLNRLLWEKRIKRPT